MYGLNATQLSNIVSHRSLAYEMNAFESTGRTCSYSVSRHLGRFWPTDSTNAHARSLQFESVGLTWSSNGSAEDRLKSFWPLMPGLRPSLLLGVWSSESLLDNQLYLLNSAELFGVDFR